MSAVCYCGREECSASVFEPRLCLQSALVRLDAERAAHEATKARLRDVAERQREATTVACASAVRRNSESAIVAGAGRATPLVTEEK